MSGEEALERIQADPGSVGMVLLDLAMPAMNGYEVCRVLRRNPRLAGIPVVALTANVEGGLQEKVDEAGFNGLITKPYSRKDLQAALKAHFRPA
jgi:CheY-like chemotaxis protein